MGSVCGSLSCDTITWVGTLFASIVSLSLGALFAYLFFRSRLIRAQRRLLDAESRVALESSARERNQEWLGEAFNALTSLQKSTEGSLKRAREKLGSFLAQMRTDLRGKFDARRFAASLAINLRELEYRVVQLEKEQVVIHGLEEHMHEMVQIHERLKISTPVLAQTLSAQDLNDRRNESQIRLVAEIAGVLEHVERIQVDGEMRLYPRFAVHLPDQGILTIDASGSLQDYLADLEAGDPETRTARLLEYAHRVRQRIEELGRPRHWAEFEKPPGLTALFFPNDDGLSLAFELDSRLRRFAIERRVLLCSPLTLLTLLKSVADSWRQREVAAHRRDLADQAGQLIGRLHGLIAPGKGL